MYINLTDRLEYVQLLILLDKIENEIGPLPGLGTNILYY